jgi:hypothetical protein
MSSQFRLAVAVSLAWVLSNHSVSAATEDPAQFALKYYQVSAAAKSPFDTKDYLSKRVCAKQPGPEEMKGMDAAMMTMMMNAMAEQKPKKVKVVSTKLSPGKATLQLEAVEIPQHYKDMAKGATSWSLKGTMVLVDENNTWKVDKDMWTFANTNKNGSSKESSGIAGPDDDKAGADSSLPSADAKFSSMPSDFESEIRHNLMKSWKISGTGKSIYALLSLAPDGKITGLKVRGENPQPAPEKQLSDALVVSQPFKPLPVKYQGQRNVWMMFDWSDNGKSISGPYFSADAQPDWVRKKVGL